MHHRHLVAAVAAGALALAAGAQAVTADRQLRLRLPGFSIDRPSGKLDAGDGKTDNYTAGSISVDDLAGIGGVYSLQWETVGLLTRDELRESTVAVAAEMKPGGKVSVTSLPGPGESLALTVIVAWDESRLLVSELACGTRRIVLISGGKRAVGAVHTRMVASVSCEIDPEREQAAGSLPTAVELPGWYQRSRSDGALHVTDGTSNLVMRNIVFAPGDDLVTSIEAIARQQGWELEFEPEADGRIPAHGKIGDQVIDGFVKILPCEPTSTLAIAITVDKAASATLAGQLDKFHCRADDEAEQVWPTSPKQKPRGRRRH